MRPRRPRCVRGQDAALQRGVQAVDSPPKIPARRSTPTLDSHRVTVVADSSHLFRRESITTFVPIARTAPTISGAPLRHRVRARRPSAGAREVPDNRSVGGSPGESAADEEESPGAEGRGHAPMVKSTIPRK